MLIVFNLTILQDIFNYFLQYFTNTLSITFLFKKKNVYNKKI